MTIARAWHEADVVTDCTFPDLTQEAAAAGADFAAFRCRTAENVMAAVAAAMNLNETIIRYEAGCNNIDFMAAAK